MRSRKMLTVVGYGLAALTWSLFPLGTTAYMVLFARMVDRVGKCIRGAPRDAMVAGMKSPELRGAFFCKYVQGIDAGYAPID